MNQAQIAAAKTVEITSPAAVLTGLRMPLTGRKTGSLGIKGSKRFRLRDEQTIRSDYHVQKIK